jgi:hypothetical protein
LVAGTSICLLMILSKGLFASIGLIWRLLAIGVDFYWLSFLFPWLCGYSLGWMA